MIIDLQTCIGFTGRDVDGLWGDKTQARMVELVANLRKAFAVRINKLDWMSAETKEKALAKLKSDRDGLQLSINNIDKQANTEASAKRKEANDNR